APRRAPGRIDIRLRGNQGQAEFVSSLEDRLFALEHPAAPVPGFGVEVAHALPGRVRLRVTGLDDDGVVRLAGFLRGQPGVLRVSPSPAARSLVVVYDDATLSEAALGAVARARGPRAWPEAIPQRPPAAPRAGA